MDTVPRQAYVLIEFGGVLSEWKIKHIIPLPRGNEFINPIRRSLLASFATYSLWLHCPNTSVAWFVDGDTTTFNW